KELLVLPGEGTASSGKDMGDQTMLCQICHKDLSHMNSQRKTQHVNKCVDKMEQEQKGEEQRLRLLEKAKTAVLDCPLCGKPFKSEISRSSHLKKCAAEAGVSTDKMLLLLKKQEEERQISVAAGIVPNMLRSLHRKQPSSSESSVSRKKRIKEPKSQFDEDVQIAMAISSSLAEEKQLLDSDKISVTGSTSSSSARETKKSRQKKQTDGKPLLLALSEEEKKQRLSNRVTIFILSQFSQEKEELSSTPVLKESNLGRKKIQIDNQSGSDDQESKEVPGLWTRSILSEKDTANKAVFYVRSLMPPIEISKASAGSRFKYLPKSPGKCRSVDQDKRAHEVDSSSEPPHVVTPADLDTTSEMIIASTQTAVILAELAGDDDGGRTQKDEEECKMSQNSQHNIESSNWFHNHININDETQEFKDASGFCPEELIVPKKDDALVLQQRHHTDLRRLVNNPTYSDMIIVTKDKQRIHAHWLLLVARCPALLQMCVDGTVLLEESSEETVLALLTYLYTGQLNLPPRILPQLVTLADRLDLHELLMVCKQMVVSQNTRNAEVEDGDDFNEYGSHGLKDVWGESNTDSEDQKSEMSNSQDNDKENDFISAEDYQDIMCTQRRKIGNKNLYESDTLEPRNVKKKTEMNDGFGTSKESEKKEWKSDSDQSNLMIGSINLIQSEINECDNDSSQSDIYSERHSQASSMEDYTEKDKTTVNMNDTSRKCWLRDKDKFLKGPCDVINYSNMRISFEHENMRNSTVVIKNNLEGDVETRTADHESHNEMKSPSFPQQAECRSEEDEVSLLLASPINVRMEPSDVIIIEDNTVKDSPSKISVSKSPSPRGMVTITKSTYRDKFLLSGGEVNDNNHKNSIHVENANEKCVSILDVGAFAETSLANTVICSGKEHLEKGKQYIIDNGASSVSASPVICRRSNSFERSAANSNTSIQTPEKELDISSDLFSSPTPIKNQKDEYKKLSPFRDSCIDERKMSTPVRDMDIDMRKVEMNQNGFEISPCIDSGSKKRKMETYLIDDKTPKRAAPDRNSSRSKKDIFSPEKEDLNCTKRNTAEQNDQDIEIVGDNFSEMCAQSPTFSDRWKSKWTSKDQNSEFSISSNQDHFIGKLTEDPDIDIDIKGIELEEAVRLIEYSISENENEMVTCALRRCEGQIVDIKDRPSQYIPTDKSPIKTNVSPKTTGSILPVLDEHLSILADSNVWDDFDDCGAGFGEGITFTPLKSASQTNDAKCSQTHSARKSSISDDENPEVVLHGKTQPTDDYSKNNLCTREHSTDNNFKGDNLKDSLMNKEEDEAVFNEDSFIWMVDNMPVDESNSEIKEEKSFLEEENRKAVNFKTPETTPREKKVRKEWIPPSPFTPMPNYVNMSTPLLKKEMDRYGVKPLSKKRMLLILQEIYQKTHQYETDSEVDVGDTDNSTSQEEKCPSSSQESDISEVIEESFMEEKYTENDVPFSPQKRGENLTQMMMKFIQDHPEIHIRMLMYEPLELDWLKKQMLDAGIKCSVDKLMNFLDEKCITFTMKNQRKDSRRGRGKKKRAKPSKDPS
ncbi:hypothetical protein ACJMK2_031569, partial [Sinanodonta woodiana]